MIDKKFEELVESGVGCVVIMAGSGSDDKPKKEGELSHLGKIVKSLEEYGIPYNVRICSAHKQPTELEKMIDEYSDLKGPLAIVAVAGGTDALSGTASYHSVHPVISCPPDTPNNSCLTNPPGSSNAYIARPENVGKFIAQMFSQVNPKYHDRIIELNDNKINDLQAGDKKLQAKYAAMQAGQAGGK